MIKKKGKSKVSQKYYFTSESVGKGHPDKVSDQISDAVLDAVLEQDPKSRVACETFVLFGKVIIGGEITTKAKINVEEIARKVLREIGYVDPKYGFDVNNCVIINELNQQSPDISQGVDAGGAGDQGIMFGYACDETPELMPLAIMLSHKLVARVEEVRKSGELGYLGPDCKSQVTVEYDGATPKRVDAVVLACQHTDEIVDETGERITDKARAEIIEKIAKPIVGRLADEHTKYYINETGKFVVGGPQSDTGLTGRKIVVDTYGGYIAHGGGAFSGKDSTKVDRSATYMTRYITKNIVAAGLATRCLVQLSYAIGHPEPVSIFVDTYGTGTVSNDQLVELIRKHFELKPQGIIESLNLRSPNFQKTAAYGHFGREEFTWEKTDKAEALKKDARAFAAAN